MCLGVCTGGPGARLCWQPKGQFEQLYGGVIKEVKTRWTDEHTLSTLLHLSPHIPHIFPHLQVRKERDVLQERMAIAEGEVEKASSLHRREVRRAAKEAKQVRR